MESLIETNHTPASVPPGSSGPSSPVSRARINGNKRKRSVSGAADHSPTKSDDLEGDQNDDKSRNAPKRACNECRQQKLRCDVVPDPFTQCSRCQRLKLDCRIDANFKRVGKRSRNAEMEREIVDLRRRLAEKEVRAEDTTSSDLVRGQRIYIDYPTAPLPPTALHQSAAGSLLDLRHGTDGTRGQAGNVDSAKYKRLDNIVLSPDRIEDLFTEYWNNYHQFLPFLDPEKSPNDYYELSPLLFWTVITVAARRYEPDPTLLSGIANPLSQLVWSTIAAVPQNYHVAKALAILCTWPLPTKSTSTDQTFILTGIMMQVALQCGLHRPSHNQEFSRFRVHLREEDIQDRLKTWLIVNVVSQATSTSYGQPPRTLYDCTLRSLSYFDKSGLNDELYFRLKTEIFCNKVSQKFYNNRDDPIGIASDSERAAWGSLLLEDYRALTRFVNKHATPIERLHVLAAGLHLNLAAFFDSVNASTYSKDLVELHKAAAEFLEAMLKLRTKGGKALRYVPFYYLQMMVAGGFTLMRLLNSFFCRHIDAESSRNLFNNTIWAIREVSITNNDLPARLAEVLAQLWRSYGAGIGPRSFAETPDNSLQLDVRCRMSMSVTFDSVWQWREQYQFKNDIGMANFERQVASNPTNPSIGYSNGTSSHTNASNRQDAVAASTTVLANQVDGTTSDSVTNSHADTGSAPSPLPIGMAATPLLAGLASAAANTDGEGLEAQDVLNPSAAAAVAAASNVALPSNTPIPAPMAVPPLAPNDPYVDYNYEVFDPLTWMLDGPDFQFANGGGGLMDLGGSNLFGSN